MQLVFSEEQDDLREAVARLLDSVSPETAVRALLDDERGFDDLVWRRLTGELGVAGIGIDERFGGSGGGAVELGIVMEEAGRTLLCAPLLSTVLLATPALLALSDDGPKEEFLPAIAAGDLRATLAWVEPDASWFADAIAMTARGSGDAWTLTGTKQFVVDGHTADLVLVVARTPAGLSLFAVQGDASGLSRRPLETLDQTRKLAELTFDEVPARLLGAEGDGTAALAAAQQRAVVGLAAEQVGGAQHALDMAVAYAKTREQFGRPIGSFQAIKHKCADMLLRVECARSAAYYAMWALAEDHPDAAMAQHVAKSYCSEAYFFVATENIQTHGGIAFTWEHPAHLYFRRAKSTELMFGSPVEHRELLAQVLAI